MIKKQISQTAPVCLLFIAVFMPLHGQTKLLRFPDIHGDKVVFSYGGDLWTASSQGGTATRLTTHPGQELFGKFSPDGKWIAFTGQYDGDEQVYVIPAEGGIPRQLTYYPARGPLTPRWGYDHQVYGWHPDGSRILFRSLRDADGGRTNSALYTVSVTGGLPVRLPMPDSGAGDFSPDGRELVYSPLFRDFRTWKRYEGGWAQDLFIFDLDGEGAQKIAPSKRTERDPMWVGDRIYFVSDRDGTLNLYFFDPRRNRVEQVTKSTTWDVRWASSDNKRQVIYELNGELQVFDTQRNQHRAISITVPTDGLAMRPSRYSAANNVEDWELSPKGERAVFVARGDVFTVPIEKGPTRNLTNSSTAHDKHARWSPDGAKIAFVSDMSGEEQIYLIDQTGTGKPEQLTSSFAGMLFAPEWSPDGKALAFSDKDGKLYTLTVADKQLTEVADDEFGGLNDFAWSPDSNWIAYSLNSIAGQRSLYIWSVADKKSTQVTDEYFSEYSPSWDPDGQYLYYLSDRQFAPQISLVEWNYATGRSTGIFAMALRKDVPGLFPSESDEVTVEAEKSEMEGEKKESGDEGEEKAEEKGIQIDFEGLAERVVPVPVDAANIPFVGAVKGGLLYMTFGAPYYGRSSDQPSALHYFDIKDRKSTQITERIGGVAISGDLTKLLVREGGSFQFYPNLKNGKEKKAVSTNGLMVDRVPTEEWATIFDEVWRRYRDFFYVRNMHGYDWEAIGNRYRQLLPYVAHRSDLNYVLGEMIAELNVGHAYIEGGDFEIPERPVVGLPGARFELDTTAGRYKISQILDGQNEEARYRSPLTEIGVNVSVGDYVLAIDGEELKAEDNPYRLLRYKRDPVRLTVNSTPSMEGSREEVYRPITSEASLLYLSWVNKNRAYVDKKTNGRVGYIHIPDMGASGIYEFIKWYYPQIRKEGLVVDVRSNGGGNVSQWIIERLNRELLDTGFSYSSDYPSTYPDAVFYGHMACLINETSASDGDIFPYNFRKAGLGPLIGKRTWGGVVGISSRGPLLDGGITYVPLAATNDIDGQYVIEGVGVPPDIEVENDPIEVIKGIDAQLDRGISEVMKAIEKDPKKLPKRPPDPVKTPKR